jgi:hypothetical protein
MTRVRIQQGQLLEIFRRVHHRRRPSITPRWAETEDGQRALAAELAYELRRAQRWAATKAGAKLLAAVAEGGDAAFFLWNAERMRKQMRELLKDTRSIAHLLSSAEKQRIADDVEPLRDAVQAMIAVLQSRRKPGEIG